MDLISKKELLQQTGISYGQLYRWKREKLIPEEWFIKQSSYTGQETFFPREQILPRIAAILENKDKYSLTELSRRLSPDAAARVDGRALARIEEIAQDLLPAILYFYPKESYDLFDLALFAAVSRALDTLGLAGELRREAARLGSDALLRRRRLPRGDLEGRFPARVRQHDQKRLHRLDFRGGGRHPDEIPGPVPGPVRKEA